MKDDQTEDASPAGRASLVLRSRPWCDWRLTAILASVFILLGVYSAAATVVQLAPFHTENLTVTSVQAIDDTVRVTAVTDRGQHVTVEPDSDVASDYKVGSGLRAFMTRRGHYVEASGLWGMSGALVLVAGGGAGLGWAMLRRRWMQPQGRGEDLIS